MHWTQIGTYVLDQGTLVLEGVTLAEVVQLVVEVLVDLAGGTVADEQTAENTHATHPQDGAGNPSSASTDHDTMMTNPVLARTEEKNNIPGHTSVLGTLALTQTPVTANSAGHVELTGTRAGVHGDGLADDQAITDELADGLAGVGVGDLGNLGGIKPDLALATADHGGREALLGAKVDPAGDGVSMGARDQTTVFQPHNRHQG